MAKQGFLVFFFLVIIKKILSKTMHVVIIKMKFQKKQDCMKLIFISFGTDLIKLKLWLMVLTACLIQNETKGEKRIETDRWIQIPLIWVLTLRGSQINQWVREKALRCNPEYRWQQPSVYLSSEITVTVWDHQPSQRRQSKMETTTGACSTWLHSSGAGARHSGTGFYLHLLRWESIWAVTETCNGKTQGKPRSPGKIINNLIHQRSLMVSCKYVTAQRALSWE